MRADAGEHDILWARGSGGCPCLSGEQPLSALALTGRWSLPSRLTAG
jgi:hypothetical protein